MPLDANTLRRLLRAAVPDETLVGSAIEWVAECTSTNDLARAAANRNALDGAVFFAELQTAGRGQRGRAWLAPAGECLLVSVLLRPAPDALADSATPDPSADEPELTLGAAPLATLTMLAASAAAATVEAATDLLCPLKWPNDLLLAGAASPTPRKVGGILVEGSYLGDELEYAVVGIGINLTLNPAAHPTIASTATSIAHEIGGPVERLDFAGELLRQLDRRYRRFRRGLGDELFGEWRRRLGTLGHEVGLVELDRRGMPIGSPEPVFAEDVTRDGALVVRRADGTRLAVRAGEVTIR